MNDIALTDTTFSKFYLFLEMLTYRVNCVKRKNGILDFENCGKLELSNKFKLTYFSDDYSFEKSEHFIKLVKSIERQKDLIALTIKFTDSYNSVMTILNYNRDFLIDSQIDELIIEKDKKLHDFRVVNEMVSSSWISYLCKTDNDSKKWNACLIEECKNYKIKCLLEI